MPGRVVILDDDRRVVELMLLVLQREGHRVEGVTNFEDAKQSLQRQPADLLVSDLSMPGVGGIAGIRALSRQGLVRRALVVSGFIDSDAEAMMAQMPEIVGHLEKPFDIHELARIVRLHVEGPAAESASAE